MKVKVRNMESERSGRAVPYQFIINVDDICYFKSFGTIIALISRDGIFLDVHHLGCSCTTLKYRNKFLGMTTKEVKEAIADGTIKLANLN